MGCTNDAEGPKYYQNRRGNYNREGNREVRYQRRQELEGEDEDVDENEEKVYKAKALAYLKLDNGEFSGSVNNALPANEKEELKKVLGLENGC